MTVRRAIRRVPVGLVVLLVRAYQLVIAPLWIGGCRHWPTCSEYAIEALQIHGLIKGSAMAAKRLARCRPGGSMGYDPVEHTKHAVENLRS